MRYFEIRYNNHKIYLGMTGETLKLDTIAIIVFNYR